jgi:hypothetical protein
MNGTQKLRPPPVIVLAITSWISWTDAARRSVAAHVRDTPVC